MTGTANGDLDQFVGGRTAAAASLRVRSRPLRLNISMSCAPVHLTPRRFRRAAARIVRERGRVDLTTRKMKFSIVREGGKFKRSAFACHAS